ncbi:MAG: hypothetical protein ABIE22_04530 [archaeon]
MNRKGTNLMSVWWFVVLIAVTFFISASVVMIRAKEVDVRTLEAQILNSKIYDCLQEKEKLDNLISDDFGSLNEECGLKLDNEFYVYIKVNEKELKFGNPDAEVACQLDVKNRKKLPQCYLRDGDIEILTAVFKVEQNV